MKVYLDSSILDSIKALIGGDVEGDAFDTDLIIHINTYLGVLNTLGVGVQDFTITDNTATWSEFLEGSPVSVHEAVTYVYDKVRLAFDPPTSAALLQVLKEQADELGWRMMVKMESGTAQ